MVDETNIVRFRYPGAGPFLDDEVSKQLFFGRDKEVRELASRVEVCRLTLVYGRSGLGKSSLLKAGLTTPLRERGYFPVFVRVNHVEHDLTPVIADYVEVEAGRQEIEHIKGDTNSPWEYFKTLELWEDDQLLIPVIIFDQFEEVFSTVSQDIQDTIVTQVGLMASGAVSVDNEQELVSLEGKYGSLAPKLQIILVVREDYLGHLEEVSDEIPGIFDSRFRVTPLGPDEAREALILPAAVVNGSFQSPTFSIDEELVSETLSYLESGTNSRIRRRRSSVEPFQLQLIGRRFEETAKRIANKSGDKSPIVTLSDIGGKKGLVLALSDFYVTSLKEVKKRRHRKKVRALCTHHLISMDGKRESLGEEEINRRVGLRPETLRQLTESRLLRTDTRADKTYYELSHDTLVEPILSSQGISFRTLRAIILFISICILCTLAIMTVGSMASYSASGDIIEWWVGVFFLVVSITVYRKISRSYLFSTRLRRLKNVNESPLSFKSSMFRKLMSASQILFALSLCFMYGILGIIGLIEFPGKEEFYMDRFVFFVACASMVNYGIRLCLRGFRGHFGIQAEVNEIESGGVQPVPFHLRTRRWVIIIFHISLAVIILVPFLSALNCSNSDWHRQYSEVVYALKISDLTAWCESEADNTVKEKWFAGALFIGAIFGIYRLYSYLFRKYAT